VNSKVIVHEIKVFFLSEFLWKEKNSKCGSDTKLMWDRGDIRVCGGEFGGIGKEQGFEG